MKGYSTQEKEAVVGSEREKRWYAFMTEGKLYKFVWNNTDGLSPPEAYNGLFMFMGMEITESGPITRAQFLGPDGKLAYTHIHQYDVEDVWKAET